MRARRNIKITRRAVLRGAVPLHGCSINNSSFFPRRDIIVLQATPSPETPSLPAGRPRVSTFSASMRLYAPAASRRSRPFLPAVTESAKRQLLARLVYRGITRVWPLSNRHFARKDKESEMSYFALFPFEHEMLKKKR